LSHYDYLIEELTPGSGNVVGYIFQPQWALFQLVDHPVAVDFHKPVWGGFERVPAELSAEIDPPPTIFGIREVVRISIDGSAAYHRQLRCFIGLHTHPLKVRDVSIVLLLLWFFEHSQFGYNRLLKKNICAIMKKIPDRNIFSSPMSYHSFYSFEEIPFLAPHDNEDLESQYPFLVFFQNQSAFNAAEIRGRPGTPQPPTNTINYLTDRLSSSDIDLKKT